MEVFGCENVLVLTTDALKGNQPQVAVQCFKFLGLPVIDVAGIEPRNTTEKTIRQGWPAPVRAVIDTLPKSLLQLMRTNNKYWHWRQAFARWITPKPDICLNEEDLMFLREALADDIAFYEKITTTDLQAC